LPPHEKQSCVDRRAGRWKDSHRRRIGSELPMRTCRLFLRQRIFRWIFPYRPREQKSRTVEERLKTIMKGIEESELHRVHRRVAHAVGAGSAEGSLDAANI